MHLLNLILKRLLDILISSIVLVILLPIFLVISFAIKFSSKGPIFFIQERRTKNGEIFKMIKFRTMVVNAENIGTGIFNYHNDPRVSKIGKILRKTSLDEIPQFINILRGQMSLIGPRPCTKNELGDFETLNKKYKKRFNMKAGLSGLAQIQGRNEISWEEKVYFDNMYIDKFLKFGILYDVKIILLTFIKVLKNDNIYENKVEDTLDDISSAIIAEKEVIRLAHIPEEVEKVKDNEI